MRKYLNLLSVRQDPKAVPYAPADREGGARNHGFQDLKGRPERVGTVPEAIQEPALAELLRVLSAPACGLFSVGCVSGPVQDERGFRHTGYIEFALNHPLGVQDATNYFPLFFHFDERLSDGNFDHEIKFDWELQPAMFTDVEIGGFTCAVFINTAYAASAAEAYAHWRAAIDFLRDYLAATPQQPPAMYGG